MKLFRVKFQKVTCVIFLVLVLFSTCSSQHKSEDVEIIKTVQDFTNAVIDGASNDAIINEYFLLSDSATKGEYVSMLIDGLREKLKSTNKKDLVYKHYDREQNTDLLITPDIEKNVFIVYDKQTALFPVFIVGKKIKAFSTLNKGGKKVFLLL